MKCQIPSLPELIFCIPRIAAFYRSSNRRYASRKMSFPVGSPLRFAANRIIGSNMWPLQRDGFLIWVRARRTREIDISEARRHDWNTWNSKMRFEYPFDFNINVANDYLRRIILRVNVFLFFPGRCISQLNDKYLANLQGVNFQESDRFEECADRLAWGDGQEYHSLTTQEAIKKSVRRRKQLGFRRKWEKARGTLIKFMQIKMRKENAWRSWWKNLPNGIKFQLCGQHNVFISATKLRRQVGLPKPGNPLRKDISRIAVEICTRGGISTKWKNVLVESNKYTIARSNTVFKKAIRRTKKLITV